MMHIQTFTFNHFQENTYVLYDDSGACVIVDPGCYEKEEQATLQTFIAQEELRVEKLINTHCHIDHVLGNAWVARTYQVGLMMHQEDLPTLRANEVVGPNYGFAQYEHLDATEFFEHGDTISFGNTTLEVRFTPGHSLGHVVFYHQDQGIVIGGDVLFRGSIGRTDLPGGDFDTLANSIRTQLYTLPTDTVVYPGHGPTTTVGFEMQSNPFVPA